uniref:Thioredoxin domain-containing protein n=1 Tax=Plectus sambesii TaxID=2011161 RepID=A0A914XIP5_9BILA
MLPQCFRHRLLATSSIGRRSIFSSSLLVSQTTLCSNYRPVRINCQIRQCSSSNPDTESKRKVTLNELRRKQDDSKFLFNWRSALTALGLGGIVLAIMFRVRQQKDAERLKRQRAAIGKSMIGGDWELVNQDGQLQGTKDFLGKWLLLYFGFTHCPDICPDEIEKMIKVVEMTEADKETLPIIPVFISIDPERDTAERVKKYIKDFSNKLIGFTGTKEQVDKVAKTFRVYHSQGPRNAEDDYIVDHTVIMYLIDPDGKFIDYYGQNRTASEIAEVIKLQQLKFDLGKKKGWW